AGHTRSGQQIVDHLAVNIREAEIPALERIDEPFMIETEDMENGGLKIMNMDRVFGNPVPEFVCRAIAQSALDAAARHPDCIGMGIVIPAEEGRSIPLLIHRRPAKLTAPDHERFIQ